MGVRALSSTGVDLPVDGLWVLTVAVTDAAGCPADVTPVVTVTLPDTSTATPAVEDVTTGVFRAQYVTAAAGRYTARVVAVDLGAAEFTATVTAVAGLPDLDATKVYLQVEPGDESQDVEIADALAAETDAQRRVCRVPAAYPADLRQALLRRVARNLALRGLPLMVLRGDAETGSTIPPGRDAEVRRLEAPWRKLVMG